MTERVYKYILISIVTLHLLGFVFLCYSSYAGIHKSRTIPEDMRVFVISQGSSLQTIINQLHEKSLAPSPPLVRLALVFKDKRIVLKKGSYSLPAEASTWDLLELFNEGKVMLYRITIPEGLDKWQTAELLARERKSSNDVFLNLMNDPTPILSIDPNATDLEGYLYPETYLFPLDVTPKAIIETMVREFRSQTEPYLDQLKERNLNVRDWVSLSSLIERETGVPEERGLISGVFHNRLKRKMLLQCDPTIIYSLKRDHLYKGKIYKSQIKYDSPYNTYVYKGLPPGPIANPGIQSLAAALNPAETPYLYFVAKKGGGHHFSKTLREHNRAVRQYRRNR